MSQLTLTHRKLTQNLYKKKHNAIGVRKHMTFNLPSLRFCSFPIQNNVNISVS